LREAPGQGGHGHRIAFVGFLLEKRHICLDSLLFHAFTLLFFASNHKQSFKMDWLLFCVGEACELLELL
jgi:hypothetical protein